MIHVFQKVPFLCAVPARVVCAALPLALHGWGGYYFIIKNPRLIYLLFCEALVVTAVLWITWEGLEAAAAYGQVEH